jgi:hypothetical protein
MSRRWKESHPKVFRKRAPVEGGESRTYSSKVQQLSTILKVEDARNDKGVNPLISIPFHLLFRQPRK